MKQQIRRGVPVLVAVVMVVAAASVFAGQPMGTDNQRIDVYSQGPVPPQVAEQLGASVKAASDAPDHTVVSSHTVKMYRSSWVRVLDKARAKAQTADGAAIVITDWGFDPASTTSVKKTEREKKITFDVVRY
jgi:hypothetical protein